MRALHRRTAPLQALRLRSVPTSSATRHACRAQPISAGGGSNKAQKAVVNKKAKGKKDDDDDDEVRLASQAFLV